MASFLLCLLAGLLLANTGDNPADHAYAEGQIWAYDTRAGEEGSLLKIQKIELIGPAEEPMEVFHLSIVGISFSNKAVGSVLPHTPVSRQTLDDSVVRLDDSDVEFPLPSAVQQGIAAWEEAQGGVFTVSVKEIIDFVDQAIAAEMPAP
ncbi:MAG: hypothetical protein AAFX04_12175 [Pseudomonadota bacterium]